MKRTTDTLLTVCIVITALNFLVYFLGLATGCAPTAEYPEQPYEARWQCDDLQAPEGLRCPSSEMRTNESIMLIAFQQHFGALTDAEILCATRYWYAEYETRAEIYDACWAGAGGCALYRPGSVSTVKVWRKDEQFIDVAQRHESLHLILWCAGEPGSTDHSHPAFQGGLPSDPSGELLQAYYDSLAQDGGTL